MQKAADRKNLVPTRKDAWALELSAVLVFSLFSFLYVWQRIEPAIEYYAAGVIFSRSGSFLAGFLEYPGGLAEYAAAFLAQLNHLNWLGALVFTTMGVLLFLAARGLYRGAVGRAPLVVCLAPALILLAWRGQYDGFALDAGLRLLLAFGAAVACFAVPRCPPWLRWLVLWCMGATLYYVAGLGAFLLFIFLVGWFESISSRKWLPVATLVCSAILLCPVGWHVWQLPEHSWNPYGTDRALYFAGVLYLWLPTSLLVLNWRRKAVAPAPAPAVQTGKRNGSKNQPMHAAGGWWRSQPVFALGPLLAGWVAVGCLFNGTQKKLAAIEYYAAHQQDESLLAVAAQLPTLPPEAEIHVRLALYHKGRLLWDLFAFPDGGHTVVLPGLGLGMATARAEIETLLELGQVNEAERMAQESLEYDGDRPDVLRELAQINVLKNRPEAAAIFLNVLSQIPFQADWAKACLAELKSNPLLTGHPELDSVRLRMPTTDFPHLAMAVSTEALLQQLLASNPQNRMAFEYLLTHYLLRGDFKRLARQVGQSADAQQTILPRHVEEALVLGQMLRGPELDLHGLKIQSETSRRFQSFCDALGGKPGQDPAALAALAPEFGDTYWYYYYSHSN